MLKYCLTICIVSLTLGAAAQADTALVRKRLLAGGATAHRIAQKMKDTLQLSDTVTQQLYQLTLQIQQQKYQVLDGYRGNADLPEQMARLEYRRDSLYSMLLNAKQYEKYQSKKNTLVSNN